MTAAVADKPKRAARAPAAAPLALTPMAAPTPMHVTPPNSTLALLQMAKEMGATFEQAQQLIRREEEKAYTAAFAAFSAETIEILKTKHVDTVDEAGQPSGYDHEELYGVLEAVKPHLSKHGLTISFDPERRDGQVYVTCTIAHVGGHSKSSTLHAEPEASGGKNHVQAIGSVVTYLERYTAKAILGLAAKGQDNDGRGAGGAPAPAPSVADPLEVLRNAGTEAAKGGMTPLTDWWKKLDPKQRKALSGPFGGMRRVAIAIDKAAAK